MPKKTFYNLNLPKKKQITEAFLREFTIHYFDEASLSGVVKQLGIAKGSIYQYFDDKLDLYTYLIRECSIVKTKYTSSIARQDFPDFWSYFRTLYECGYQFDQENSLQSHFLHKLDQNLHSPSVKKLYNDLLDQVVMAFRSMVTQEVRWGLFRADIPIDKLGFMLYKTGVNIQEYLFYSGIINPKVSIEKNRPVYEGKKDQLMQTVDEFIQWARPSFDKKQNL